MDIQAITRAAAISRALRFRQRSPDPAVEGRSGGLRAGPAGDVLEIEVYGPIDPYWGANLFELNAALSRAPNASTIRLRINSEGGDVFEAIGMMAALVGHPATVEVEASLALSAASMLAMVGDQVRMIENGLMMVHLPWTVAIGNARELEDVVKRLDQATMAVAVPTYASKTGLSEQELVELMTAETWLSAADALEKGFVDEITSLKPGTPGPIDRAQWNSLAAATYVDRPRADAVLPMLAAMEMATMSRDQAKP